MKTFFFKLHSGVEQGTCVWEQSWEHAKVPFVASLGQ